VNLSEAKFSIGTGRAFGQPQPITVTLARDTWVATNAVVFPWNHVDLDGRPVSTEGLRASSAQIVVRVPGGVHTLTLRTVPDPIWLVLRAVSFGVLALWFAGFLFLSWRHRARSPAPPWTGRSPTGLDAAIVLSVDPCYQPVDCEPRGMRDDPSGIDRGIDCPICGTASGHVGTKRGTFTGLVFEVRQCGACRFSYVRDPLTGDDLYDEAYYRGQGADPIVDYVFELEHPSRTVRTYEWQGTVEIIRRARGGSGSVRWLDYGCGTGGLVRHARLAGFDAWGYEDGHGAEFACKAGVPLLDRNQLAAAPPFDVVTAVEVIEHVFDVRGFLSSMRKLLAPEGLLFYTTGNPNGRHGKGLLAWSYLIPEIHVSLFEPATMERALAATGFRAEYLAPSRGLAEIVRFKVLKNVGVRKRWPLGLPWGLRAMSSLVRAVTA